MGFLDFLMPGADNVSYSESERSKAYSAVSLLRTNGFRVTDVFSGYTPDYGKVYSFTIYMGQDKNKAFAILDQAGLR